MKKNVLQKILLQSFWVVLLGAATVGFGKHASARRSRSRTKRILGYRMTPYVSADKSYSFLKPRGWKVKESQNGASIVQKPNSNKSARVDLLVFPTRGRLNSNQMINLLAKQMKQQYPSFMESSRQSLSKKGDITAVVFTYKEGKVLMSGIGIAASAGQVMMWGDIYGPDNKFKGTNPGALLFYMMGSLTKGRKPRTPKLPKINKRKKPTRSRKRARMSRSKRARMKRATVMSHAWNNLPHIMPKGVGPAYWGW
jgi:hypothetical protein